MSFECCKTIPKSYYINMVKYIPFIIIVLIGIHNIEIIHSCVYNNYVEYRNECGDLLYIRYAQPITKIFEVFVHTDIFFAYYLYINSKVLKFCVFHRLPIYFILFDVVIRTIADIVDIQTPYVMVYSIISISTIAVIFILLLIYLWKIIKMNKSANKQSIN